MIKKNLSALVIGFALLSTSAHAGADKACLKKAKADYHTALGGCKALKSAEKKECGKTAKEDYSKAKEACKAPAPAAEPTPAPAPAE
jgi:hypothetical protein